MLMESWIYGSVDMLLDPWVYTWNYWHVDGSVDISTNPSACQQISGYVNGFVNMLVDPWVCPWIY